MKIGYIRKRNLELNPQFKDRFVFVEDTCRRSITSKSDRVYSTKFYPLDYEEIVINAELMKKHPGLILVGEPFLLDSELREKAVRWVKWANTVDESEYNPFAMLGGAEDD